MLKTKLNLRIVAAIAACLAVTAVFASCDKKTNGDDDDDDGGGGGKREISAEEKKLVGSWGRFTGYNHLGNVGSSGYARAYVYIFNSDGTFLRYIALNSFTFVGGMQSFSSTTENFVKGIFEIKNNKINFSNVVFYTRILTANDKWRDVGTRSVTRTTLQSIPTSGFKSIDLEPEEYKLISTSILGVGKDDYGDFLEFELNW